MISRQLSLEVKIVKALCKTAKRPRPNMGRNFSLVELNLATLGVNVNKDSTKRSREKKKRKFILSRDKAPEESRREREREGGGGGEQEVSWDIQDTNQNIFSTLLE